MIAPYATATQEAHFIHCTIFENYSRFAGALQVPPSTTTRLLNSLLHGNESRESTPGANRVVTATASTNDPVGTVVVSGTNHQSGAFASGITPAADSYSAVPRMAWDGIHLASPTATNGQSLLGRTIVAHTLTTNPIGMGATPPTDWDNELLTANASSSTVVPSESGCDDWRDSDSDQLPDWYETHVAALSARDGLNSANELTPSLVLWDSSLDGTPLTILQILTLRIDPSKPLAAQNDTDLDDLADWQEYMVITDYRDPDTDNDGMTDGWEDKHKLDPRGATDATADPDGDGLSNLDEFQHDTNPKSVDSDGDGISDKAETDAGSDPNNKADKPKPNDQEVFDVSIAVGDTSDSASESWTCDVIRHTPSGTKKLYKRVAGAPGPAVPKTFKLKLGYAYELKLKHRGSTKSPADPDYDFEVITTSTFVQLADSKFLVVTHEQDNPNKTTIAEIEGKSAFLLTRLRRELKDRVYAEWTKFNDMMKSVHDYIGDENAEIENKFYDLIKDIVIEGPIECIWKEVDGQVYPTYDTSMSLSVSPKIQSDLNKLSGKLRGLMERKISKLQAKIALKKDKLIRELETRTQHAKSLQRRLDKSYSEALARKKQKKAAELDEASKIWTLVSELSKHVNCLIELFTSIQMKGELHAVNQFALKAKLDRLADPKADVSGSSGVITPRFTIKAATPSPGSLSDECSLIKDTLAGLSNIINGEVQVWFAPKFTFEARQDGKFMQLNSIQTDAGYSVDVKIGKKVTILGFAFDFSFKVSHKDKFNIDWTDIIKSQSLPYDLGNPAIVDEKYIIKAFFRDVR